MIVLKKYCLYFSVAAFFCALSTNFWRDIFSTAYAQINLLKITVVNNDNIQTPILSRIIMYPPDAGIELGPTNESGELTLPLKCTRNTRIQAKPRSDTYLNSEPQYCYKREKLQLRVTPILTAKNLGYNLFLAIKKTDYGLAALAANELKYIYLGSNKGILRQIEGDKKYASLKTLEAYKIASSWHNFKIGDGKLIKFMGNYEAGKFTFSEPNLVYFLHPVGYSVLSTAYSQVNFQAAMKNAMKKISGTIKFEIPTSSHAEFLAYVLAAKALKFDYTPRYDRLQRKFVMGNKLQKLLTVYQGENDIPVTGKVGLLDTS